MSVTVCLPLFGSPDRELEPRIAAADLRRLGEALHERLDRAADLLDLLLGDGWSAQVGTFDVILTHPKVDTAERAVARLRALGIDPEQLLIVEDIEWASLLSASDLFLSR
jgi:hypothetical protein